MKTAPVPADVIVLTGFLGAGKTTLLNRILTAPMQRRIAVIVNEFGEIGIDRDLLLSRDQPVIQMSNGCICCNINGDLLRGLLTLAQRREQFDTLVIETTGLADPAPVIQALHADVSLRDRFRLRGVVTVVDAKHIATQLHAQPEARRQVAFADLILINKTDLVSPERLDTIERDLRSITAQAALRRTRNADADITSVLSPPPAFASPFRCEVAKSSRHDFERVQTLSLTVQGALDGLKLGAWLQTLASEGADIWRIKGILRIWGDPDQFWFQGVQREYDCRPGRRWRDDEPRDSRMVLIGRSLDEAKLREGLQNCITHAPEPSRMTSDRFGRWHDDISPQRLDQIRFWIRQNFGFPGCVPILVKEVPCAKPGCPPIETAIVALVEDAPPRLFKVQAAINDLTFDQVYDLMENPMPCC